MVGAEEPDDQDGVTQNQVKPQGEEKEVPAFPRLAQTWFADVCEWLVSGEGFGPAFLGSTLRGPPP